MVAFKKICRSPIVLVLLWLTATLEVHSQNDFSYEGPLQVGSYSGQASYGYRIIEMDTVLHGPFQMQRSNLNALLAKKDTTFAFKGDFQDGYASGEWRFRFGNFQSDSLTEFDGFQYRLKVSGIQQEGIGVVKKGKPHGTWTYTVNNIKNSEVEEVLFKSIIEFDNGVPQKSFRIETDENALVGRFLRDGLAHDEWTLYSDEEAGSQERWYFESGRLTKIETEIDGKAKALSIYPNPIKDARAINLDQQYINILMLKQEAKDTLPLFEKGLSQLLSQNAGYYKKLNGILSELGESSFSPEFKVVVPSYPLDSISSSQLDSLTALYKKSKAISESLLNNTQLNILRLSDKQANFDYAVIKKISENFLGPLGTMVAFHEDGIFEFVDTQKLMSAIWPDGFPSKEIAIEEGAGQAQKNYVAPGADNFDFTGSGIPTALHVSLYANQSLENVQEDLKSKLVKEERQQEFTAIEDQMIRQIKKLNQVIDSVSNNLPSNLIKALQSINALAEQNLSNYSNMETSEAKLDLGRSLVSCFTHLEQLEKSVLDLPAQMEEIESTYTDQIWNPFMANLMDEEVKKRITTAYRKVVLPYLVEQVTEHLSCENAEVLVALFSNTTTRMLEMRDEDTRKLERKLRREQNPEVVMRLFNVEPQAKTKE